MKLSEPFREAPGLVLHHDVADRLGIDERQLRELARRRGFVRIYRWRGVRLVARVDVEQWVAARVYPPAPAG